MNSQDSKFVVMYTPRLQNKYDCPIPWADEDCYVIKATANGRGRVWEHESQVFKTTRKNINWSELETGEETGREKVFSRVVLTHVHCNLTVQLVTSITVHENIFHCWYSCFKKTDPDRKFFTGRNFQVKNKTLTNLLPDTVKPLGCPSKAASRHVTTAHPR